MQQLNILSKVYRVEKDPSLGFVGETNHTSMIIKYREQSDEQFIDTILHEALHCLDYACSLNLEERQIHALSALLIDLLRTNKELSKRIIKNYD